MWLVAFLTILVLAAMLVIAGGAISLAGKVLLGIFLVLMLVAASKTKKITDV
jgi:hypothetical protein